MIEFTEQQVDEAIDYVIHHGAENRGSRVHYTHVFQAAGLPAPQLLHQGDDSQAVTRFMEAFHNRCAARELPPLDALVVHVAGPRGGLPGGGYFRINGQTDPCGRGTSAEAATNATRFWEDQTAQCTTWGHRSRRGHLKPQT